MFPHLLQGGMYVARLLNEFVCKWGLFFLCLCECVTVMWVYGGPRFLSSVTQMCRRRDNLWWRVMWSGVTPAACLVSKVMLELPSVLLLLS